jgi:hypothetical protein
MYQISNAIALDLVTDAMRRVDADQKSGGWKAFELKQGLAFYRDLAAANGATADEIQAAEDAAF